MPMATLEPSLIKHIVKGLTLLTEIRHVKVRDAGEIPLQPALVTGR